MLFRFTCFVGALTIFCSGSLVLAQSNRDDAAVDTPIFRMSTTNVLSADQSQYLVPPVVPISHLAESTDGVCGDACTDSQRVCGSSGCGVTGPDSWIDGLLGHGRLDSEGPLLIGPRNERLAEGLTYSAGAGLRYRFIDERNKLRPPLAAARTNYQQWRFTPFLELKYGGWLTAYAQAIDASTLGEDVHELIIDTNRADMLRYYVDLNLGEINGGDLHVKVGRQFIKYGSQHLLSPLAWANTYRNFEGFKAYYQSDDWSIDAFALRPVNGATLNAYRPQSYDTPDQSRMLSSVYLGYHGMEHSVLELYWIWLNENEDRVAILDGDRHTFGARYAGDTPISESCGERVVSFLWDYEGGFQVGKEDFITGPNQDIQAGYLSLMSDIRLDQVAWKPTMRALFWWGSGDDDPTDGTSQTVSTLFPLGHGYWGQIDNFNGQNLLDYSLQCTVNPTQKLAVNAQWHWFDKSSKHDAIYNLAGVPFGGVSSSSRDLGNELDLVATYQFNPNLTLQTGYFWYWFGDAVRSNSHPVVANRNDAEMFYTYLDWTF